MYKFLSMLFVFDLTHCIMESHMILFFYKNSVGLHLSPTLDIIEPDIRISSNVFFCVCRAWHMSSW